MLVKFLARATALLALLLSVSPAVASVGMVADNASKKITVFNADSDALLGSVTIPTNGRLGDCVINANESLGYVSDSTGSIWVIDLLKSPPALSNQGVNPIHAGIRPQELAISSDQKYLVACGSHLPEPIRVFSLVTRTLVSSFSTGGDSNSLDLAPDGTALVPSARSNRVRALTLSGAGVFADTGKLRAVTDPVNGCVSRDGRWGVAVTYNPGTVSSFSVPNLATTTSRTLPSGARGVSAVLSPGGDRCFVRTTKGVVVYSFNAYTGALGASPLFQITAPYCSAVVYFGMDQIALSPDGQRLYVGVANALNVFDAQTGAVLSALTSPGKIVQPTGVYVKVNHGPVVDAPSNITLANGTSVPVTASLFDAEGDPITLTWRVNNGAVSQTDALPLGAPPTTGAFTFTRTYAVGTHTLTLAASDGYGGETTRTVTVVIQPTITITGVAFLDSNNNQRRDAGEVGQANWRIYADANNNSKWDPQEPSTLSTASGAYALVVPVPATYYIREVAQTGWKQTAPTSGYLKVIASQGMTPVCDFGNRPG
ncbi:MAG: PKD domain-containing protein [Actinomycetota bacterium]